MLKVIVSNEYKRAYEYAGKGNLCISVNKLTPERREEYWKLFTSIIARKEFPVINIAYDDNLDMLKVINRG